jgi:2-(1,2-epoxy-1,2-dihydrophenyl)acetyl-CoA isomerase
MNYETILYEADGPVAIVTLNRPEKRNAWTRQMAGELVDAFETANGDPAIGAIVLTGAGKGFCAGADIKDAFKARMDGAEDRKEKESGLPGGTDWADLCRRSKPMIAAVNGASVGVGATMILPFDVIMASEEAKFGMFFVKMGLVPELASSHFLERRVGFGAANELCLTARLIDAHEAGRLRLADHVVPADELLDRAKALGREMSAHPDRQLRLIKGLLRDHGPADDMAAVQRREGELLDACYASPEHKEAVAAFLEKRTPVFR